MPEGRFRDFVRERHSGKIRHRAPAHVYGDVSVRGRMDEAMRTRFAARRTGGKAIQGGGA